MNPNLKLLQPYPFEKLVQLKAAVAANASLTHIGLSIGEPKHATPPFIAAELQRHLNTLSNYPITRGSDELRQAIAQWLASRFRLGHERIDPEQHVLPVNGTREALFAFAQCVVDHSHQRPLVLMPNPFYQIYEGATLLAGAEPYYINTIAENNFVGDFDAVPPQIWNRCQLLYICSPGNPTGAVMDADTLAKLIHLADKYDFIIAADECYSELYFDESQPPLSLLQVAASIGRHDYQRCVVFHSLSKRSNAPGLRSGFVAGDSAILAKFLRYRTYHGCAMPLPLQHASIKAWQDETHVEANRTLYRQKFAAVVPILADVLDVSMPDASFYLWPKTPIDDTLFAQGLYAKYNVTTLPGRYLSRQAGGINPGENRVRMALVASIEECIDAAHRIRDFVEQL